MPKSIHKSIEIHLKTLRSLNVSKQGSHKSGTPETPGNQDTRNRLKNYFLAIVGRRVCIRASNLSQMDQPGAMRTPKGYQQRPKWSQNGARGITMMPKVHLTNQENDVQRRSVPKRRPSLGVLGLERPFNGFISELINFVVKIQPPNHPRTCFFVLRWS